MDALRAMRTKVMSIVRERFVVLSNGILPSTACLDDLNWCWNLEGN